MHTAALSQYSGRSRDAALSGRVQGEQDSSAHVRIVFKTVPGGHYCAAGVLHAAAHQRGAAVLEEAAPPALLIFLGGYGERPHRRQPGR